MDSRPSKIWEPRSSGPPRKPTPAASPNSWMRCICSSANRPQLPGGVRSCRVDRELLLSVLSQKFAAKVQCRAVPRLLGAVAAADALVGFCFSCVGAAGPGPPRTEGVRRGRVRPPTIANSSMNLQLRALAQGPQNCGGNHGQPGHNPEDDGPIPGRWVWFFDRFQSAPIVCRLNFGRLNVGRLNVGRRLWIMGGAGGRQQRQSLLGRGVGRLGAKFLKPLFDALAKLRGSLAQARAPAPAMA